MKKIKFKKHNWYVLWLAIGVLLLFLGVLAFFFMKPVHPMLWIIAGIVFALLIVMVLFMWKTKAKPETDYRAMFVLGIFFLALYFINDLSTFFVLGIIFIVMGLANKDKWGKTKTWHQLSPPQRKLKMFLVIFLGVLVLVGVVLLFFVRGLNGS